VFLYLFQSHFAKPCEMVHLYELSTNIENVRKCNDIKQDSEAIHDSYNTGLHAFTNLQYFDNEGLADH